MLKQRMIIAALMAIVAPTMSSPRPKGWTPTPEPKRKEPEPVYRKPLPTKALSRSARIERDKDISAWNKQVEEKKAKKRR